MLTVQLEAGDSIISSTQWGFFFKAPHPLQILLFGKQGALHRWHRVVRQTARVIVHPGREGSARSRGRCEPPCQGHPARPRRGVCGG